ncbi:hypothetical protein BDZ91DRAFT_718530 [Kalaharituber pfeilii]|nr:hypothetical protein BDZ91DRAFT_718530 [Kalaharituber pfeilii]
MATGQQRIIIGIDFGTTYSGVAWASTIAEPLTAEPIRQWPGATGKQDLDKIPSEMRYPVSGGFKWGCQAAEEGTARSQARNGALLQFMKLLLDPSQENKVLADPLDLAKHRANIPLGKKPVDVVTDYLSALKTHTLETLSKTYGAEFWKVIPIEYHLTIPAVWSDAAKALTLEAANRAGIGTPQDIVLIAEPEAAAMQCLTRMYEGLLKEGDIFVVADCGGGTVDLVTYKILTRRPQLRVEEVCVGGGLCGSVFINRRFEAFAKRRLGNDLFEEMVQKSRPYTKMMKDFDERLKRKFTDAEDQEFMDCDLGGIINGDDEERRIYDGYLEIDRDEMRDIFEPVIQQVIRLVKEQIDKVAAEGQMVSSVLMVGGFGGSPYLHQRLSEAILESYRNGIRVLQPDNPWSAVVRGSVICGLQMVKIQSRRARCNYGVKCIKAWRPGDPVKYKYWCNYDEEWKCRNRMNWYIRKGDAVPETKEFVMDFRCKFPARAFGPLVTESYLLGSNSPGDKAETNALHHNVFPVCKLTTDLNRIRQHLKISVNSKGEQFYDIDYQLVMRVHSAQLTFEFRYQGVTYGEVTTVGMA